MDNQNTELCKEDQARVLDEMLDFSINVTLAFTSYFGDDGRVVHTDDIVPE